MKKLILFTLMAFAFSLNTNAQSVYNDTAIDNYISEQTVTNDHDFTYVGTPYFNETFQKGIIYKNNIVIAYNVWLRYNANSDVFEIKKKVGLKDNQAKYLIKTDEITIKINNDHFVYIPSSSNNNVSGYFTLIYKGEHKSLYKKTMKLFIAGQKAYTSLARNVEPTYKEKEILFLSNNKGEFKELPNSKNGKIKIFEDHTSELKQYVKENNLNINKEYNLKKLVNYYETL